jgi:hypothetical protein
VARAWLRILIAPLLLAVALVGAAPPPALGLDSQPSLGLTASYEVDAAINFGNSTLAVDSRATVVNSTGTTVASLTFNAATFRLGNVRIDRVNVNGEAASWGLDDQSVGVTLLDSLAPGKTATVRIAYTARFLGTGTDKNWLFAKLNGTLQAYRWIPWLSRETRFDRQNIGEPFVTATSPRVKVTLTAERTLAYVTSGQQTDATSNSRTFVARDVRDFNFVARPSFRKLTGRAEGVRVTVFYNKLDGAKLLSWAKQSVSTFTRLVGAYPYSRLRVAESGGGNAMESPQLVWIPRGSSSIGWLVAHEVAHQWFYGVVGNNQALEPFADEALATLLGREATGRRISTECAKKALDKSIYEYKACYYGVIYVQGADYLTDYRRRVGEAAFWRGIRNYYQEYKFGIGGTRQLLDALDAAAPAGTGGQHDNRFPGLYGTD